MPNFSKKVFSDTFKQSKEYELGKSNDLIQQQLL